MSPMPSTKAAFLQDAGTTLGQQQDWAGLHGDALGLALANAAMNKPYLVVVDEADRADRLLRGLRFFHPKSHTIKLLPCNDVRPYDGYATDADLVATRIGTMRALQQNTCSVVIAPIAALMQRLATPDKLWFSLNVQQEIDRDDLARRLIASGYLVSAQADRPGRLAMRGDILDVWTPGRKTPVRVDFFDNVIESLKAFVYSEPGRFKQVEQVTVYAAREEVLDEQSTARAKEHLNALVSAQNRGNRLRRRIIDDLSAGIRFAGIEGWLPALTDTITPMSLMGGLTPIVVFPDDVAAAANEIEERAQQRWEMLDEDERPLVLPTERYIAPSDVLKTLGDARRVWHLAAEAKGAVDFEALPVSGLAIRGSNLAPATARIRKLAREDHCVGVAVPTQQKAEHLLSLFEPHGLNFSVSTDPASLQPGAPAIVVGDLPEGFICPTSLLAWIPSAAIFGQTSGGSKKRSAHAFFESAITSLSQIKGGDPIVHRLHGIGRYHGLERLTIGANPQDFVKLEYRGGDLLFLPATQLSQISRFSPANSKSKVLLDKLGGVTWSQRKKKVQDSLLQMAQDLLRLYAKRQVATRPIHPEPGPAYQAFVAQFPYTETIDQAAAIDRIQAGLSTDTPLDHLLCGDVGFGKTEVAMRAAMRMIENGQQVAVLCPTTVLALQHLTTFKERFASFDLTIGMLSRFSSPQEEAATLNRLRQGTCQIVIGTTKLLSRELSFAKLGLIIIDEEHRFGVKQKERLKKIRTSVDVLSMSATPIPRSLQMGLSGLRDMSIMATPPQDRLSVRTSVSTFKRSRIRDAITNELKRKGQVFFIHNRVQTIARTAERLRRWVPEASFEVAHGQMDTNALEDILVRFLRRDFDVLVCTSIMETGIDMPNVNTIVIDQADRFGLAQLYQLRGRVGRSSVRASCLLITPESLTSEAKKRIRVLVENTGLGAGFHISAADLEMRGAGNLLGEAQSGNIDAVGLDTWLELLEEAAATARGEISREQLEPEVEVPVPAFIPEQMFADVPERLGWYQRFSDAKTLEAIERLLDEIEQMTHVLPAEVKNLAGLHQTRLQCQELGIARCNWLKVRVVFELHDPSLLSNDILATLRKNMSKRISIREREGRPPIINASFSPGEGKHPFRFLRWLLTRFKRLVDEP